ncbi:MAG TPA: PKD domain-containing protein [Actinocrinis sp.]|uniref:PKD domain-containing protein n=1 Tax=Actinocrinis sp. TaxID=1920516 RepID=UPI002DDD201B|nr:PKD domain-containing protein [Actinocrinis sp.]HEV2346170.1 PKD domain-containing protein [Actinocrinis sp.]
MHKRHLVFSAAVVAAVGGLVPASAYAGTAADTARVSTASTAGTISNGKIFTSQTVGTLTAVLQFSDFGTKTIQAFADGSTDTGSTITGYSFSFGDGSAPLNSASGTAINHWYSKPGTYTVSVTVADSAGNKATASGAYTTKGTNYTPYVPTRLLDTRNGTGAPKAAVAAGGTVVLKVGGTATIPANAQAAVLNLTVTAPTANGTITAYPDGETEPGTQNVTFIGGQTVATLAIVKLGPSGSVDLTNNSTGTTQLIADVTGYFTAASASGYTSLTPARLLDTRYGTGAPKGVVGLGKAVTLTIAGADGGALPAAAGTVKAVALNVTVTGTIGGGYITAYPDGTTRPTASNLNFNPGDTLANMVIVPVGADGKIDLYNYSSGTQLIADVAGYFSASGASDYTPIDPTRVADTRSTGNTPIPGAQAEYVVLDSTASGNGVAVAMTGFVLTTTVTNTVAGGYLTVYPYGVTRPVVSNLNFSPGQTAANLALATAGQDSTDQGKAVDFYNGSGGNLDMIADMAGFFDTF